MKVSSYNLFISFAIYCLNTKLAKIVVGDFNQVVDPSEKYGGIVVSYKHSLALKKNIAQCLLTDLGFQG